MNELNSILKSIKNKEFLPVYFFHGVEPHYIDVAVKAFENDALEEDEKAFNQTVVYGKDTTFAEVLSLARQFPMMGEKQVIILKEAQEIRLTDKETEALKAYAENPVPTTLLVIAYKHKKIDSRKSFVKVLTKNKMIFHSDKIKDYQVSNWISEQLSLLKIPTKPNIPLLLSEYLGTDLSRIFNELSKLKMILKDGEILDEKIVEKHIGISKEFNSHELLKFLGKKDAHNAFRIAYHIGKNSDGGSFPALIGSFYNFFTNLIIYHLSVGMPRNEIAATLGINPYFLNQFDEAARFYNLKNTTRIISILREMDMKKKGLGAVNMKDSELLKELVFKILNVDKVKVKV